MDWRVLLIVSSLLASLHVLGACSSSAGGKSQSALYYPAPVNYSRTAGILPALSEGFESGVPSSPPFKP
jgi:hypothetical protein